MQTVPPSLPHLVPAAQALLLALVPSGGQRTARRNAWAGRSADAARARATREAEAALRRAEVRAQHPAVQGPVPHRPVRALHAAR